VSEDSEPVEVPDKSNPSKPTVSHLVPSTRTKGGSSPAGRFVLPLLALCFCYVTYRALHLEITGDEANEVLTSIHGNRYRDLVVGADWHAQAHFLNVLLAKPCVEFLPLNEIAASRVPSLFGLLLFLWGVWKVGTLFPTGLTRALITLALVSNACLLDYLALSRGYGLALGFGMLSLSFLLDASLVPSAQDESVRRQAVRSLWLASGSALASMAFLYLYAAVLIATLWLLSCNRFKLSVGWCINAVLLGIFYLPRVLATRQQDRLFWGGDVGFVHDTVASLVRTTFYDVVVPAWLIGLLSFTVTLLVCFLVYWSYREGIHGAFLLSVMTVLVAAFCIVANLVWHVKYPIERAALFLVTLVVLDIGVVAAWSRHRWLRFSLWGMLLVYTGVGMSGANLSHTQYCRKNADIASVLLELGKVHNQTGQYIQIAVSDGSKWTTWYYAERLLGLHLAPAFEQAGYMRIYEWLTVYEWRGYQPYLVDAPHNWLLPGTTHLLLDEDDLRLLAQFPAGKVVELKFYPASGMRLFAMTAPECQGALRLPNGSVYVGAFKDGQLTGHGTMTLPDGTTYVCEFKDGVPNGFGTMTTPQGRQYVGEFLNGLPSGQGSVTASNGTSQRGEWRAGKKYKVSGTWVAPDGTREEGTWNTDGSPSGGTITWKDGRVYEGDWQVGGGIPDPPDGTGVMTWPDGRKYAGQFRGGKMDGHGKMTYPDGKVEEGLWKADKFLGAAQ
jgi:hypothetical protein